MPPASTRTALIIGASRGLGLGMARELLTRGWHVVGTVRNAARRELFALADRSRGKLAVETVDINEPDQVAALRRRLNGRRFDLLFVNAGIAGDLAGTIGTIGAETFTQVMVTNALSPMRVVEALQALVPASGTIGVMSSGLGSVADNEEGGWEVYRASKAALNTMMRSFAARHAGDPRSLLLIAPGWVRTDMGGPEAPLDVETSMRGVVDTIIAQAGKPGLQYLNHDGRTLRW
ncbi:SDR family NAD(P)-dependent oxidoreductase [Rhodopila globiformis]|uniref:3-oxoacyl-ACP reductase n=1 Tax=Rhodopila globiformis TaxID=1071 RepID=A0A2S6N7R0_RHOGL|nr:SDR family NAD(P)-dependent oxidoreductase [Rhodopila globiformis]PPQ30655.1 3-oxoacyl-ACP reductase [Rhodopila globiformis]